MVKFQQIMRANRIILVLGVLLGLLAFTKTASARGLIVYGSREVVQFVHELPNEEEFQDEDGNHIDLGIFYKEYHLFFIPVWIVGEPKLVGCDRQHKDTYYTLSDEYLDEIISEYGLDRAKLLRPSFAHRYGGKLLILAIIGGLFLANYLISKRKKAEKAAGGEQAE